MNRRNVLVVAILGFSLMQSRQQPALEGIQLRSRLPIYGTMVGFELFLFAYVWLLGLRLTRTPLRDIIGGRWPNAAAVIRDVLAAFVFWIVVAVVLVVMGKVLGVNNTGLEAVGALLPQGPLEIAAWIALCVTAGFCEELVFRGYLQRQFSALIGRVDRSIALQAIVFGIGHMYQGFKGVITIAVYGALFGILAIPCKHSSL